MLISTSYKENIKRSRPRNLDLLKKKWTSFLGLETGPGGSRGGPGAGRALAGAERRPKKSPAGKNGSGAGASAPAPEPIFPPPATFSAGAPRRPARARPRTFPRETPGPEIFFYLVIPL